jgi:hypothetical protein
MANTANSNTVYSNGVSNTGNVFSGANSGVYDDRAQKRDQAHAKMVDGVYDVRKAWHPTQGNSPAYREVQKIHASLVSLAFFAKDFTNEQIADMYGNVLIEQKYHGDVNATAGAFNTIFASVRPDDNMANTVANTGHDGNEWFGAHRDATHANTSYHTANTL